MARNSECEHDIGVYRVVGGEGLDVVEKCSECGTLITHESPKTAFYREQEEKKARKEAKKRKEESGADKFTGIKQTKEELKKAEEKKVKFTEKDDEDFWVKDQIPKGSGVKKSEGKKWYK